MGLRKALKECPGFDYETRAAPDAVKSKSAQLFAPELGGAYEAWTARPMHPDLVTYAGKFIF
jgi:exonuclease 3'-5' domain-containing protein 1